MAMDPRCDVSLFPGGAGASDVRLDAGRTLRLPVAAGTVLVARAGRLRVQEPPRWLGERMVVVGQDLAEGQAHAVGGAGWVEVGALDAAGGWLRRIDPVPVPVPVRVRTLMDVLVRGFRILASTG
jgi:hypothetical protein